MKYILSLTIIYNCFFAFTSHAQSQYHSSVSDLSVFYESIPYYKLDRPNDEINCIPKMIIKLKEVPVDSVIVKLLDTGTSEQIYTARYSVNGGVVTNQANEKMFEYSNGEIKINTAMIIPLRAILFEIRTKDSQNNLSEVYSAIK